MVCASVVSIDTVEPCSNPDVSISIFSKRSNRHGRIHPGWIGCDKLSVVTPEQAFVPGTEPQISTAIGKRNCRITWRKSFWPSIGSERAFAPSTQSPLIHSDPQIAFVVEEH